MNTGKIIVADETPGVLGLFEAIAKLLPSAKGFNGVIVRSVGIRYSSEQDFFSGAGAAKSGGRWNRKGLQAVYASLDVITATHEAYQNLVKFGFSLTNIRPRVTAGAAVELGKVLDLTVPRNLNQLGFSRTDLLEEDWRWLQDQGEESWTQAIGRGAFIAGFEGLLAPSARHLPGKNIVIFPENLQSAGQLMVLAAHELP